MGIFSIYPIDGPSCFVSEGVFLLFPRGSMLALPLKGFLLSFRGETSVHTAGIPALPKGFIFALPCQTMKRGTKQTNIWNSCFKTW